VKPADRVVITVDGLTNEWGADVAPRSLDPVVERLEDAIARRDLEGINDALVAAWMLGARDATVELNAQMIEAGVDAHLHMTFTLPWDADLGQEGARHDTRDDAAC
jgi:hypothetical protein